MRSIPACAGEPPVYHRGERVDTVYPRVCGGTPILSLALVRGRGLSPRVRGNPRLKMGRTLRDGSIPACAGEPCAGPGPWAGTAVYPRVCGGTLALRREHDDDGGLSPRVRGNPPQSSPETGAAGSIPACAGEPLECGPGMPTVWVYPRVCGGTLCEFRPCCYPYGLSPRVRGNRFQCYRLRDIQGSIPACAGEPALR